MKSRGDNVLVIIAVVAVAVAVIAAGVTYFSVASLVTQISGYVTSTGQANLSVESVALINFTTNFVNWGSGRVNDGSNRAQLTTLELNNVTDGNWTLSTAGGLRIENIGNVNVSLNLTAGKSAAQFIGGTSPGYQWNVSNLESGSCDPAAGFSLGAWDDTSATTTAICDVFQFADSADFIRIDLNLTIPSDSQTGALTDTITALAETA